jgi:hypothetical protein
MVKYNLTSMDVQSWVMTTQRYLILAAKVTTNQLDRARFLVSTLSLQTAFLLGTEEEGGRSKKL